VKPRTAHFQIRISEELRDKLKAFSKDEIREALQRLVDEANPTKPETDSPDRVFSKLKSLYSFEHLASLTAQLTQLLMEEDDR
jgi:hypothetical protein